jgi:Ca-activated chloride channel homolog
MIYQNLDRAIFFAIIPIVIGVFYAGYIRRQKLLTRFIDKKMWTRIIPSLSQTRRFWKKALIVTALFFFIFSLIRPQYGTKFEKRIRKGQDILIAIDTSLSMQAEDVKPTRLEHAKREILGLVENLKGDRIGLLAFSGSAYVTCPLTLDYAAVKMFLGDIEANLIPRPGTNIGEAIKKAIFAFSTKKINNKVLILISDGESFEGNSIAAAKQASQSGIRIFTVGIGGNQGEPIPYKKEGQKVGSLKRDSQKKLVLTKLNKEMLTNVAMAANGRFFISDNKSMVIDSIYKAISASEREDLEEETHKKHKEQYHIFLFIGVLCLLLDFGLSERKKENSEWKGRL